VEFIIKHKTVVAFGAFTIFCFISLTVQSSSFTFSIKSVGSVFMTPFQKIYNGVQDGVSRVWAGFTELDDVRKELSQTQKQLQKYESVAGEINELREENNRLRKLLGLKQEIIFETIPASIISKDPDNWFRTIVISRGENDGIKENMPVIAYSGGQKAVVGKIVEVRGNVSRVLPIISPDIKIGVKLLDSNFPGLISGYSATSQKCIMDYISKAAQLKNGESIVVTSGQGGVFPPGLIIGVVEKSILLDSSAYQRAIVRPMIDFSVIEEVFVIKKEPDKELLELLKDME
jgi:rod shape-determining protein MreC